MSAAKSWAEASAEMRTAREQKAADAKVFRKLVTECDTLPHDKKTAVHHILDAVGGGGGKSVHGFLHELAVDVQADAWLAQSGPRDDGDDDIGRLRFGAFKRAGLLVHLLDILTAEELSK